VSSFKRKMTRRKRRREGAMKMKRSRRKRAMRTKQRKRRKKRKRRKRRKRMCHYRLVALLPQSIPETNLVKPKCKNIIRGRQQNQRPPKGTRQKKMQ
jgi:hypothetical protein